MRPQNIVEFIIGNWFYLIFFMIQVKNQQKTERYSQIPKVPKSKKPPRAKSPKPPCSGDESVKLPKAESSKSNGPSSSKAKTSKPAKPKIVKEKAAKLSDDSETGEAVHEESRTKKSSTKNNRPRRRASKVSYVKENGEGNRWQWFWIVVRRRKWVFRRVGLGFRRGDE